MESRTPAMGLLPRLVVAAAGLTACGDAPRYPDALLITVDTLRADYVSAHGSGWAATPTIDGLAGAGVLFEHHHAPTSQTAPSHASLFTGLFPREHGLRRNGQHLSAELPGLPATLRGLDYRTVGAVGARVLESKFGFDGGFEVFDDFDDAPARPDGLKVVERRAKLVVDSALVELSRPDSRPLFLWVHLFDPHAPYSPPDPPSYTSFEIEQRFGPAVEASSVFSRDDLLEVHATYASEVRYTDRHIGRLLEGWDARGDAAQSLVVLTSDHGQGLGEHAYAGHGLYLYEEQLEIPLVMRMGGRIEPGRRVERVTSTVDLAATMLELLGVTRPPGLGGQNLLAQGRRDSRAIAERRTWTEYDLARTPAHFQSLAGRVGGGRADLVTLIKGRWKYVWSEDTPDEMYDLATDPGEAANLASKKPERARAMSEEIRRWRARTELRPGAGTNEGEDSPELRRMLEALGY